MHEKKLALLVNFLLNKGKFGRYFFKNSARRKKIIAISPKS